MIVGTVMAITGAGGGILAVPALANGMHLTMQQAAPIALIAVSGAAATGAMQGLRAGIVRYRAAFLIAIVGLPFTSLGLLLASHLPQSTLRFMFAVVLLWVAGRMILQARQDAKPGTVAACQLNPETGRLHWKKSTFAIIAMIGASTGFTTGLLGVGGGFIIVPALKRFTNIPMHGIVATSLMVIALVGTEGVMSAVAQGATLPLQVTCAFAGSVCGGMLLGRQLSGRLPARYIHFGFATVLALVACMMLLPLLSIG